MIRRALVPSIAIPLSLLAALAGCTSKSASGETIAVTATDSTCEVAQTNFESGPHTFRVTNKGSDVTELYVYGAEDRVEGEVENVGPGTSRDLEVSLAGGTYELACKPGQKGDGIRTSITVSGEAAAPQAAPERTVDVKSLDRTYEGLGDFTAKVGETVEFRLVNVDQDEEHELEVLEPDEKAMGEVEPLAPGASGSLVVTFTEAGTYTYLCGITDHAEKGMKGTFTVAP